MQGPGSVANGCDGIVQLLVKGEERGQCNSQREDHGNAVHETSVNGYDNIVQLLLDYSADINPGTCMATALF